MSAAGPATGGPARRSLIFRFTIAYAGLFCAAISGVLGYLYWSTLAAQKRQVDAAIEAEAEDLRSRLAGRTVSQMAAVITQRTGASAGQRTIYLLETRTREYAAGNLREWPRGADPGRELREFPLAEAPASDSTGAVARGRAVDLPSGERLLVGRNVTELEELRRRIAGSLAGAVALSALLGIAGGYVFSRRVSARLDEINRNSEAILGGDLRRRMPVSGRGDEFDALAVNLNRMLERLDGLMSGMREVSDDIAHDMRSPISRLRSRIEVALMGPPDAEAYREALEQTVADTERVLEMFESILTIALAEAGAARDRFTDVDLAAIARESVEVYEPVAEDRGISLVLEGDGPVPLRGEPHLLARAIANLIDNAVKYVPEGGRVVVGARRVAAGAELSVADDGPGIPEAFRDKALERFTRLEASRSAPGSGLGLSLVRAVARLHGGRVALEDASPGLRVRLGLPG